MYQLNTTILDPNKNNIIRRILWCVPPLVTLAMKSLTQNCVPTEGDSIKVVQNDSTTNPVYIEFNRVDDGSKNLLDLANSVAWTTSGNAYYVIYFE